MLDNLSKRIIGSHDRLSTKNSKSSQNDKEKDIVLESPQKEDIKESDV
jgi:hypothetical protein